MNLLEVEITRPEDNAAAKKRFNVTMCDNHRDQKIII